MGPLFTDHMVLQQNAVVPLWGTGPIGTKIEVVSSWGQKTNAEVDREGHWEATLETPSYGGPYELEIISGSQQVTIRDVMIGEVWLASGQSNMEWTLDNRILNQKEEIATANFNSIRMFSVPRDLKGQEIKTTQWQIAQSETIGNFSAVGYFFAREIFQKINVPIGIINSSWGGTRVEAWMRLKELAKHDMTKEQAEEIVATGGYDDLNQIKKKFNDSIRLNNERFLNKTAQIAPKIGDSLGLLQLDMEDHSYSQMNLNTDDWTGIQLKNINDIESSEMILDFEFLFMDNKWAEDGMVWYRKKFDFKTQNDGSYELVFEGGVDDWNLTFLNGVLIGQSWTCCSQVRYTVPQEVLREGENTLAIRVIDTGGLGGFRGNIFIENEGKKYYLEEGTWHFKHQALYLNGYLYPHSYSNAEFLRNESKLDSVLHKGFPFNENNALGILNANMIQPLLPYKIKGALWYQGESNVGNHQEYQELFSSMIFDWRRQWNAELPFYYVQIAPFKYTSRDSSQALREAQRKSLAVPKTGMVVTLDIGEKNDIHPANKQDVGKRLALHALKNEYGFTSIVSSGPLYKGHEIKNNSMYLFFDYAENGLVQKGALKGFEIADENSNFLPGQARIENDYIVVSHLDIKNPKYVRYGWKNYFDATLFNQEGLPASSFITD